MSEPLQKVFMILVRPYYINEGGHKVFYDKQLYGDLVPSGGGTRYPMITNNTSGNNSSPVKINSSAKFQRDPWYLHSVYTSYANFRAELKGIIAVYGTDNVKCSIYLPIDYEVLPNQ
jgi:hypothetical protein